MGFIIFILVTIIVVTVIVKSQHSKAGNTADQQAKMIIDKFQYQADLFLEKGDHRSAIDMMDKITQYSPDTYPHSYFAYFGKAGSKFKLEDYAGALKDYDKAAAGLGSLTWALYVERAETKLKLSAARNIPSLRDDALADFNYALSLLDEVLKRDHEGTLLEHEKRNDLSDIELTSHILLTRTGLKAKIKKIFGDEDMKIPELE